MATLESIPLTSVDMTSMADVVDAARKAPQAPNHTPPPPLILAILRDDTKSVRQLLDNDQAALRCQMYYGLPALAWTCSETQSAAMLEILLEHQVEVEEFYDSVGCTALHMAAYERWDQGALMLIEHGASPNALMPIGCSVKGFIRETPLHIALRTRNEKMAFLMLGRADYINVPAGKKASGYNSSLNDSVSIKYHKPTGYGLFDKYYSPPLKVSSDGPILSRDKNVLSSESIESFNESRKHKTDLKIKDGKERTAVHLAASSLSPRLLSVILEYDESKKLAFERDLKDNTPVHALFTRRDSTVHDDDIIECLRLLINYGLDLNKVNYRGQTALYLAVRNQKEKVVELLMNNGADASIDASDGTSPVHIACKVNSAKCLEYLFNSGQVYGKIYQETTDGVPFHIATCNYGVECIKILLKNGDHLAQMDTKGKTRCDHLLENIPTAVIVLEDIFDEKISSSGKRSYEADYSLSYDYTILFSLDSKDEPRSIVPRLAEKSFEKLLSHPLIETFLFAKWNRIKHFFYINVLFYSIFLALHTYYVVRTFGSGSRDWSNEIEMLNAVRVIHIIVFLLIFIPDFTIMCANLRQFLFQWETAAKVIIFSTSAYIVFSRHVESSGEMWTEKQIAAISIFFSWAELMLLLGRFPVFGIYILMFSRVSNSIFKFLIAFSSLLIGFSISFSIIFKYDPSFSTFHGSFVKTLMMMIGEIDYGTLLENSGGSIPVLGHITLVVFLFLVPIIVANLLIGLAVSDIPDLINQGNIRRLSKQALYLQSFEMIVSFLKKLTCFPRVIRIFLSKRARINPQLTITPNKRYLPGKSKFIRYFTTPPFPDRTIDASVAVIAKTAAKNPTDLADIDDDLDKNFSIKDRFSNIPYVKSGQYATSNGRFTLSNVPGSLLPNGNTPDQFNLNIENYLTLMQQTIAKDNNDFKKIIRNHVIHVDNLLNQLPDLKTNSDSSKSKKTSSNCSLPLKGIQFGAKSSEYDDEVDSNVSPLETKSLSDPAEFGDSSKKDVRPFGNIINNKNQSESSHIDHVFKILTAINARLEKQEAFINEFVSKNTNI